MKRTETKYFCDCCRKEVKKELNKIEGFPILALGENDRWCLIGSSTEICDDCFRQIGELYYSIARKNGNTGQVAILEGFALCKGGKP